jgi:hypothetical protein
MPATSPLLSYAVHACCDAQFYSYDDTPGAVAPVLSSTGTIGKTSRRGSSSSRWPLPVDGRQEKRAVRVSNGPSLGRKRPRRATTGEPGSRCRIAKATGAAQHSQMHFLQSCPTEMRAQGRKVRFCRPDMKKGRPEIERPKSREETPKWANDDLERPAPPRNIRYDRVRTDDQPRASV